ncbi:transposase [Wolbachia endosymbiont of Cylisticus convexus]|uniref:transposase n=1 Tax=Wolbachia endosymbiont of Cylisticus convexus TaxID=118728 RepID=UPI001F2349EA|nr:transposase [Wolbachia endosymbiont of Cylisticus convexus]
MENVGCKVLFLPPYSPDLNPIKKLWFAIKHAIRKALPSFWPDIHSTIDFVFQCSGKPYFG